MKVSLFLSLALCICSFFGNNLKAQENVSSTFLNKLAKKTDELAQEKVYLHLDKPYYAIGDNIWFKVYTQNAKTGQPSYNSGIVYVELIDSKNTIAKQLKLPLIGGVTWGDFKLTDSLSEGNYRIRAYTQWMRNAGPEFFFDKTVKIGNSWANKVFTKFITLPSLINTPDKTASTLLFSDKQNLPYVNCEVAYEVIVNKKTVERGKGITNSRGEINLALSNKQQIDISKGAFLNATITLPNKEKVTKEIPYTTPSAAIDVQFLPEGGRLVENLPNKVGVKALNSKGLGERVKGVIVTADGIEISKFETNKFGIGSAFINPINGQTYKVIVDFEDGGANTFDLPKAEESGTVLFVNNLDTAKMSVKIYLTKDLLDKETYQLIAHHNGAVYFSSKISSSKQVTALTVSKKGLPSGIIQISLLNSKNLPINERLVFINNTTDKIETQIEGLPQTAAPRKNVSFNINAFNNNKPVSGSFSIAVTNTTAVKPDPENESNILTSLLLTSDLTGYVEKPNYYFLKEDKETRADLDNLLLTQGWRKINWKEILDEENIKPKFDAEHKLKISGVVTKGGKPVVKGKIVLVSFSGGFFSKDTLTDENGRFNFDKIEFPDNTKFVVQARTEKDRKFVDIVMDEVPSQIVTKNPNTGDIEVNINYALAGYLEQSDKYFDDLTKRGLLNKTIVLNEVTITEKRKTDFESSNLNGAGNADAVITAKELENAISLGQFLQGRVAGVQVSSGKAFSRNNQTPMAIVVDGMNFGGEDVSLDDFVVNDIETVEILKSGANTAIYGMQGGAGVIVITTKKGGGVRITNPYTPGLINYMPKGFANVREFYAPKYETTEEQKPDMRTTVFWHPQIVTDAKGKTNISFYNTDVTGQYRIVLEGIDSDGNIARKVFTYEVK